MSKQIIQAVLSANREVLGQSLPSFRGSLEKCRSLNLVGPRSFEVEESLDALTSKFARVSDIFTLKVLKSLVLLTREDAPTFVDRMNLCEKIGVISSAANLIEIRDLRNQIAHEYLSENLTEIYGDCLTLSEKLLAEIQVAHPALKKFLSSE